MPTDRTFVTELATALGMVGDDDLDTVLQQRPTTLSNLGDDEWAHLQNLREGGTYRSEFNGGFANGRAFLTAPDALAGRRPRIVEWTGGRHPPGDEVAPSDLRVDHVYLVSCKYLSKILHNLSPSRLLEGLLLQGPIDDARDWFGRVAPKEYQALYEASAALVDGRGGGSGEAPRLPPLAADLTASNRRSMKLGLRARGQDGVAATRAEYALLCRAVSESSADRWKTALDRGNPEAMLWRLLRIGSAPYFVLGSDLRGAMRLRIDTPWDWRQAYRVRRFEVTPQTGGQPRVGWAAYYDLRSTGEARVVRGHVELRWSHGRFAHPPEAKVYLDTPHHHVPGYHPLDGPLLT